MYGKIITLHAPKSVGTTTVSLNMAVSSALMYKTDKVLFLQLDLYGDLPFFCGREKFENSWGDIAASGSFSQKNRDKKMADYLLKSCSVKYMDIDVLSSPTFGKNSVELFSDLVFWENFWEFLRESYDLIFIDLSRNVPEKLSRYVIKNSDDLVVVNHFSPAYLSAVSQFFVDVKDILPSTHLCLNQADKASEKLWNKYELSYQNLGTLARDDTRAWKQFYRGIPIVSFRFAPWRRQMRGILGELFPEKSTK